MPVNDATPATSVDPNVARLHDFWIERYRTFSLSESGWLGAGEEQNRLLYRCKIVALERAIRDLGKERQSSSAVLDAGCGQGFFADYYQRKHPGWRYTGIDLAESAVTHLTARHPSSTFAVGDVTSWRPEGAAIFDLIQSFDVLHLLMDDLLVARALENLAAQLHPDGALLVTAALPDELEEPNAYIRHMSRRTFAQAVRGAGLHVVREYPIYYWLPDGGPRNRYLRAVFARLGPAAVFAADRLGLALGLPRWFQPGADSRSRLVVLQRNRPRGTR